jgi:hypothetical protein
VIMAMEMYVLAVNQIKWKNCFTQYIALTQSPGYYQCRTLLWLSLLENGFGNLVCGLWKVLLKFFDSPSCTNPASKTYLRFWVL